MQMRFPNYVGMIGPTYVGMVGINAHEGTIGLVLIGQGRSVCWSKDKSMATLQWLAQRGNRQQHNTGD